MCPCDLFREIVCGYHTREIEALFAEVNGYEPREQQLSVEEYDRLCWVRGQILRCGLRADIVKLRMAQREWEKENAA